MMTITISIPNDTGNVGIHTSARDVSPSEIKPMLLRAIHALQAELDAVDDCPYHQRLTDPSRPAAGIEPGHG